MLVFVWNSDHANQYIAALDRITPIIPLTLRTPRLRIICVHLCPSVAENLLRFP